MCHFITAAVPRSAKTDDLDAIAQPHGRCFIPCVNPFLAEQLPPGHAYYATHTGHCDCGTAIGSAHRKPPEKQDIERKATAHRRAGWSETKIRRWLDQQEATAAKHARVDAVHFETRFREVSDWIALIRDVLDRTPADAFCLLLHFYSQSVDNEPIALVETRNLTLNHVTPEILLAHPEDTLLCIQR